MRQRAESSQTTRDRVATAWREVGHTEIAPFTAWTLTVGFLAAIFAVPAIQLAARAGEIAAAFDNARATRDGATVDARSGEGDPAGPFALLARISAVNDTWLATLQEIERVLDERSIVAAWLRPWVQFALARWLGAGNEQVYPGRDGWLFYRRGVDFVSGPPFPALERSGPAVARYEPRRRPRARDPMPAILDFKRQLDARGIALILVPVPDKLSVHPERLVGTAAPGHAPLTNPAYAGFIAQLERHGVLVFDPTPLLIDRRLHTGRPQYLATDTHWRPEAVAYVAEALAAFVTRHLPLAPRPSPGYVARPLDLAGRGDLVRLLDVPARAASYGPERVSLRQIQTARGGPWQPDPNADVLLLGDSFTNMYSLAALGWGTAAGLAEQLAYALDRPVDRIALNDNGAFAPRLVLQQEVARGRDRLAGKRVVLWQFVAHELAFGDWRPIALQVPQSGWTRFAIPRPGQTVVATGVVRRIAPVPRPGSVPYRDHIVAVHVTELVGSPGDLSGTEALVYVWSLRDNIPQEGSRLRPGDPVRLRLRPWSEVADELDGINRSELDQLVGAPPWWGELEPQP